MKLSLIFFASVVALIVNAGCGSSSSEFQDKGIYIINNDEGSVCSFEIDISEYRKARRAEIWREAVNNPSFQVYRSNFPYLTKIYVVSEGEPGECAEPIGFEEYENLKFSRSRAGLLYYEGFETLSIDEQLLVIESNFSDVGVCRITKPYGDQADVLAVSHIYEFLSKSGFPILDVYMENRSITYTLYNNCSDQTDAYVIYIEENIIY